jgi:hypothetical protein
MSNYDVIWNGDVRGPYQGLLCLDPTPRRSAAADGSARVLALASPEVQDAAVVLLQLLERQGHVCHVAALAAQSGLPEFLVAVALTTLCARRQVRRVWLPRPAGRSSVAGYQALEQPRPQSEAC